MVNPVQAGKKFLQGLLLAAACATTPPFQAKRDYATYPDYKGDIAFYNMENILKDNCLKNSFSIGRERFYCQSTGDCLKMNPAYTYNNGLYTVNASCGEYAEAYANDAWKDIQSVTAKETCLKFNGEMGCDIYTRTPQQAQELAEAIMIYVQELRKK